MSMKDLFRFFIIHFCAIMLVGACSSGDNTDSGGGTEENTPQGGGATPTPEPTPGPTAPPAATPTPAPQGQVGEFIVERDLSQAEVAQTYYNLGCQTPGAETGKKMIDPRLRVNDTFRESIFFFDPVTEYQMDLSTVTKTVGARESFFNSRILQTNIPGTKKDQMSTTTCQVVSDAEGDCQGSSSAEIQGVNFYIFVGAPGTPTYQKGWFVLDDGFGVPAWRKVVESAGIVLDPMQFTLLGPGSQTETFVYLPDVPSSGLDFCGGNNAFTETLVHLDDGTRLNRIGGQLLGFTRK